MKRKVKELEAVIKPLDASAYRLAFGVTTVVIVLLIAITSACVVGYFAVRALTNWI
jgi:hypothetical protein